MEIQHDAFSLLTSAYKDGKWSDITIMNGDKKYRVHKIILSTSIPYFDKMLSSKFSESTSEVINLDHTPDVFDLIIQWAYCSKIKITKENAADLFNLADYMNIPQLTSECLNFLWNNFSESPLIDIDHWMDKIRTEEARKIIDRYIRLNFCDIVNSDQFLEYSVKTVTHIISLNELNIDNELQVFKAVIKWIQADDVIRSTHLPELLKKVHWVNIDGEQFMKTIRDLDWIKRCVDARAVIMAALELSFYKSLESIKINDFNFDSRQNPSSVVYTIEVSFNSTNLTLTTLDALPVSLTQDFNLPAAKFGDLSVTEYAIENDDAVIRIDWKNGTYRFFKNKSCIYSVMCDRIFQFGRNERQVNLWKGDRQIKISSIPENVGNIFTVTKHEGSFYLTSAFEKKNNSQIFGHTTYPFKSNLILTKYDPFANSWKEIAHYEVATNQSIKMLESSAMHDSIKIYVDRVVYLKYYFDTQNFQEVNRYQRSNFSDGFMSIPIFKNAAKIYHFHFN